jgi:hypothetical protein
MMDVCYLLKQFIHKLTGPANYPEEDLRDSWEDIVIRLALQHWILLAGRPIPNWEQLRHFVEIEQ